MKLAIIVCAAALASSGFAQNKGGPEEQPSWAPKPIEIPKYVPPHKPVTRLVDLKKQHAGETNWRQLVVADKGSLVQVPMQTIYSIETVGDKPALRYEVNVAHAKTFYPMDVKPPEMPGFKWLETRLSRKPGPYGPRNLPHVNLFEMAKNPKFRGQAFVTDDRSFANIIYGYENELPPLDPKNPGHYHPESSESWLIMLGQIRYPIEGQGVIIADEGDIVYVPMFTFHAPRYHGNPSCRLA